MERELIKIINSESQSVRVVKKGNQYYIPKSSYIVCSFDTKLLPVKLSLPMVCQPLDWKSATKNGEIPRTLSDLTGGYLCEPTGEMYDRYRLLSSGDIKNFDIEFETHNQCYENLCVVMNKLQSQAFEINSDWLKYLKENVVSNGLLMPVASLTQNDVTGILREFYMKDEVIKELCSYSELLLKLCSNIQCARYERFLINNCI